MRTAGVQATPVPDLEQQNEVLRRELELIRSREAEWHEERTQLLAKISDLQTQIDGLITTGHVNPSQISSASASFPGIDSDLVRSMSAVPATRFHTLTQAMLNVAVNVMQTPHRDHTIMNDDGLPLQAEDLFAIRTPTQSWLATRGTHSPTLGARGSLSLTPALSTTAFHTHSPTAFRAHSQTVLASPPRALSPKTHAAPSSPPTDSDALRATSSSPIFSDDPPRRTPPHFSFAPLPPLAAPAPSGADADDKMDMDADDDEKPSTESDAGSAASSRGSTPPWDGPFPVPRRRFVRDERVERRPPWICPPVDKAVRGIRFIDDRPLEDEGEGE